MSGIYDFSPQPMQASNFPSMAPGQMGMQAGFEQPSYNGISGLNSGQPQWAAPGTNFSAAGSGSGVADWFGKSGNLSTAFGGIQALGSAWLGFQQMKQARDALNFQKKAYSTNLANSTKTYNTNLEDRINGRTADYAGKAADVSTYLKEHKL